MATRSCNLGERIVRIKRLCPAEVDGSPVMRSPSPPSTADALVTLVGLKEPPVRFAAGADAVQTFEAKANTLLAQAQAHRDLSDSLAYDDA